MRENLIHYIDSLFADTVPSSKARELYDEMVQNTLERYDDERAKGCDERTAYNLAVAGIGDVEELLRPYRPKDSGSWRVALAVSLYVISIIPVCIGGIIGGVVETIGVCLMFFLASGATALLLMGGKQPVTAEGKKKKTMRVLAISLYIICVTPTIFFDEVVGGAAGEAVGVSLMFLIAAVATVLIVYACSGDKTEPRTVTPAGTVEAGGAACRKSTPKRSVVWGICTAVYWVAVCVAFSIIGGFGGQWHWVWIIFPFAGSLYGLVTAAVDMLNGNGGGNRLAGSVMWLGILTGYCFLTYHTGAWLVTWLLFPIGAALGGVVNGVYTLVKGARR